MSRCPCLRAPMPSQPAEAPGAVLLCTEASPGGSSFFLLYLSWLGRNQEAKPSGDKICDKFWRGSSGMRRNKSSVEGVPWSGPSKIAFGWHRAKALGSHTWVAKPRGTALEPKHSFYRLFQGSFWTHWLGGWTDGKPSRPTARPCVSHRLILGYCFCVSPLIGEHGVYRHTPSNLTLGWLLNLTKL